MVHLWLLVRHAREIRHTRHSWHSMSELGSQGSLLLLGKDVVRNDNGVILILLQLVLDTRISLLAHSIHVCHIILSDVLGTGLLILDDFAMLLQLWIDHLLVLEGHVKSWGQLEVVFDLQSEIPQFLDIQMISRKCSIYDRTLGSLGKEFELATTLTDLSGGIFQETEEKHQFLGSPDLVDSDHDHLKLNQMENLPHP